LLYILLWNKLNTLGLEPDEFVGLRLVAFFVSSKTSDFISFLIFFKFPTLNLDIFLSDEICYVWLKKYTFWCPFLAVFEFNSFISELYLASVEFPTPGVIFFSSEC